LNNEERLSFLENSISELEDLLVTMKEKNYPEEQIKQFELQKFMMQTELYNLKTGRRNE
jgi:hypothetical protein